MFPFGHGLSYTTFKHDLPAVTFAAGAFKRASLEATEVVTPAKSASIGTAIVQVQNVGDRDGDDIVLLFAAPPFSEAEREENGSPLHNLIGFDRVHVRAGETVSVSIPISSYSMSFAGKKEGTRVAPAGGWKFWTGTAKDGQSGGGTVVELL